MSIPRSDTAARIAAVARNFQFFDAPVELMICMDRSLNHVDSLSIGMYLEALVLRLTEMGVGSCLQVSISGYAEVVKRELGIGEEMEVICGMAVGIEDVRDPVNMIRTSRADVKDCVTFVEE
jgi:nitroreductase